MWAWVLHRSAPSISGLGGWKTPGTKKKYLALYANDVYQFVKMSETFLELFFDSPSGYLAFVPPVFPLVGQPSLGEPRNTPTPSHLLPIWPSLCLSYLNGLARGRIQPWGAGVPCWPTLQRRRPAQRRSRAGRRRGWRRRRRRPAATQRGASAFCQGLLVCCVFRPLWHPNGWLMLRKIDFFALIYQFKL